MRLDRLQPLGRALMLPIAVLPAAGMLLRLGQPDLLDIAFVAGAGQAIFAHLGLLFAIGVAVGLARENHGAAGLAGAVAFLVTTEGAKTLLQVPPEALAAFQDQAAKDLAAAAYVTTQLSKLSIPAGILSGIAGGMLYNRFANISLPEYLAFFAGRRFVPIIAGFVGLFGALLFGLGFPWLAGGIDTLSRWVVDAGALGLFVYGTLNRLLVVTGLHHILNNLAWFIIGDYHGVTGDLKRYYAGDPTAGAFMAGYFPVMMFGLPAACLAMYRSARPERRKAVGGMLFSLALTAFLTGITEPIEFTFMFLAPALYAVHAVLTGLSAVLMNALGVKLGFGFSAGLFDYVLGFGLSTRPLMLIPVGLAYFALYYGIFRFCIIRFDLKTPGREPEEALVAQADGEDTSRAGGFVGALGGATNFLRIDACMTRLRLELVDPARIDEPRLRALGAKGIVRPGGNALQVVLGPIADQVAGEIRDAVRSAGMAPAPVAATPPAAAAPAAAKAAATSPDESAGILAALGGDANIRSLSVRANRLLVDLVHPDRADEPALATFGVRGVTRSPAGTLHVLLPPTATGWAAKLAREDA
ncbi:PTS N-acetyl-D-glucosamine transporter [Sphingomonas deserti]|uniref:PTS N-acetyl-D-glucosamine transporter n=1 Tax=Allosphingosinicella deserti TaxID=2116704 RepID=A0A2P7QKV6_9SPHN|nr:PTS N-acetyl-D-glucosamine transporter [Sphingomonas deserti]